MSVLVRIVVSFVFSFGCGVLGFLSAGAVANSAADGDAALFYFVVLCLVFLPIGAITGAVAGATIVQKVLRQGSSFWRALLGAGVGLLIGLVTGGLAGRLCSLVYNEHGVGRNELLPLFVGMSAAGVTIVAGAVIGSGWKAEPASSSSGMSRAQQGVISPSDTVIKQPGQPKCPFCYSTTFRVQEEAGSRRCSDCHSVLPNYVLGNP